MPENGLISYWIEDNNGWRFLCEIRVGNVDDRSKSVIREIGAEDDRIHARANAEGVDRHIRRAVQGRFHSWLTICLELIGGVQSPLIMLPASGLMVEKVR